MKAPEDVARELAEIIRRDRREQAETVLPLVRRLIDALRRYSADEPFRLQYMYGNNISATGSELRDAEEWLKQHDEDTP